jgi:hypothetical protein
MKTQHTLRISEDLIKKLDGLPGSRSAAIEQALKNVGKEPYLLALAFRYRLTQSATEPTRTVTYLRDRKLADVIEDLIRKTELSGEQVTRLAIEAFVHKL